MSTPPQITVAHIALHWETRPDWERLGLLYIGRQHSRRSLPMSLWANQFKLPDHATRGDREECLRKYAAQFASQAMRCRFLPQLAGKTLLCWCGGASLCHGHFLAAAHYLVPANQPERWADACRMAVEYAIAEQRVRKSDRPIPPTVEALRTYGVEVLT
jgi:hypothetical protein